MDASIFERLIDIYAFHVVLFHLDKTKNQGIKQIFMSQYDKMWKHETKST